VTAAGAVARGAAGTAGELRNAVRRARATSNHIVRLTDGLDLVETRIAEPQRRLMAAVLKTAVDDYRAHAGWRAAWAGAPATSQCIGEVLDYVASGDRAWPFSFENLCDALGIDPALLRRTLREEHDDHRTIQAAEPV